MTDELKFLVSPVCLYDMSIEDVNERREKALKFETVTKAANFLGIPAGELSGKLQYNSLLENRIKNNSWYAYHKQTKKKYAPRYLNN